MTEDMFPTFLAVESYDSRKGGPFLAASLSVDVAILLLHLLKLAVTFFLSSVDRRGKGRYVLPHGDYVSFP